MYASLEEWFEDDFGGFGRGIRHTVLPPLVKVF